MSVNAKSVVFDIVGSHNPLFDPLGVRAIDFLLAGVSLGLTQVDYVAYATSTAIVELSPEFAFDTSLSLLDSDLNNSWRAALTFSQRLIIVFNTAQDFDTIVINNYHNSGGSTAYGAASVDTIISSDDIVDVTYGAVVSNSTLISSMVWAEHTAVNEIDNQTIYPVPVFLDIVGGIGLSGEITATAGSIASTNGNIGLSGYVSFNEPITISGGLGLSGSAYVTAPKNTLQGSLGLSGSVSVVNNVPVGIIGSLALSGKTATIRINKDVSSLGGLGLSGAIFVKTGTTDCSIPSFDSSRWA